MVHITCDKCGKKIEQAYPHCKATITMKDPFDPVEPKTLDLCKECEQDFISYAKLRVIYDD